VGKLNHLKKVLKATTIALAFSVSSLQAANVSDFLAHEAVSWNNTVINISPIADFYTSRSGEGIWTTSQGMTLAGKELIKLIEKADIDGLEAKDYLSALPKDVENQVPDAYVGIELYLSQAFVAFGRDLYAGRTTPSVSDPEIVIKRKKINPTAWLESVASEGPKDFLAKLRPSHPQYAQLRQMLVGYRNLSRFGGWEPVSKGATLKPGMTNTRVSEMRNNLIARGYSGLNSSTPELYDDGLKDVVMHKHVFVNQAAFQLHIREGDKVTDRRKVIVGKEFHKTPIFSDRIRYAEFNPTWTVPPSIAGRAILPKLKQNPGYLAANDYQLFTSWKAGAPAMSPASVNWNSVNPKRFPYRIVQKPGRKNALGQVKFMFPNKHAIYLHDTSNRELFAKSRRAYSSGCIRVHKPMEFAEKLSFYEDIYDRDKLVGNILFGNV